MKCISSSTVRVVECGFRQKSKIRYCCMPQPGYPFHDTATPGEARENIQKYGVPADAAARLMSGNAARFLGL